MKISRLIGGAITAASLALPAVAQEDAGGTLVIVNTQVPRHLNGAI